MNLRNFAVLTATLAALAFTACGSSSSDLASTDSSTTPADTVAVDTTEAATSTPDLATAPAPDPAIPFPTGAAPKTLVIKDLKIGTGPVAKDGDSVSVNYVGAAFSDQKTFDSSFPRGEPFVFTLGAQEVIAGWDQGVAGMKVGGRRMLVIPPDLGYGEQGQGPIKPNETLVFVVDLLQIG
ncbi:MAG: FKBP-type peptidyl-prolyl cis-trans isomerase [Solirubrobacterales bacterium]|nr:FKBP-type peptidyl-prolyl cis-trans isomerase [Solirubrobacterales bacterium]